ncbi:MULTISPECIES: bifunctional 5,6,7,8-tetrahydromethanopterin hydro-lyase/3-hexulose-6-phosphate synthase [Archaeoglobus]|jgi:bifunctional enzyme Fae/Hps|uniref:Bifunctional enzyme Fae/Hps n=3 Tax=Archaeoglobus fulgidus TaxID=2234 RepID=FAEHP_ARCFU|nr:MULTISPECIES: bifunctional 5,6,7,8-tetrahydromethanopterin hydro-lyase/3-hexulose-6-phosphate synthase [Archaeoglobus]O28964.1 RecName: Full=Bifunctional enzyme Fae/Hps; Includes: RecName: Full=5,6,7,8-tetrahydromethanopterin hydro-lyase; AltName: Full=Formaldehyde-activating enzyme; Short=Fae; Includes: RecName: Full=3-hexulose-6-phosphate synthase; Short=HPS; AltName: Full=D-arabino-3-hexulose-6-phosphate formaldehyde lyase [Archaeoglobus fulgidus DSM 4304]AAB89943.1 D-arabino 3-hexulose 6-p
MEFRIGEALIGEGFEVAHVDLIIGTKDSPAGIAFANALANLSAGHTPLLAVLRPNLITKPPAVIVPKVTVKDMHQAELIFGPAQAAVAKAVADAVEEGIIPRERADEYVVVASVFIHPNAKNKHKIYYYNYGATKLAIKRAMQNFPDVDTVLYEKDRSFHPFVGRKLTKLWDPPYLQIAIDIPDLGEVLKVLEQIPDSDHIVFEVGTPLAKRYGCEVILKLREVKPDAFYILDLKTLDVGNLEARMAADATANAVVISGLAPTSTIVKGIREAEKTGILSYVDMMNVDDPIKRLEEIQKAGVLPNVVELHRAIDSEDKEPPWMLAGKIKEKFSVLVAVAGGIRPENVEEVIAAGADIIVVGRAVTKARDVEGAVRKFMSHMKPDTDQFRIMTDF